VIRIAQKSIAHPRAAIAVWVLLAVGLGALGSRIEERFAPSILVAKGTESARAEKLGESRFGASVLTPIMLVGPRSSLDKQGPPLVAKLRARTDTRVLSPWDGTPGSDVLRPKKTAATIVAAIERPEKQVIETSLPQIERTVDQSISGPVKAHVTGQASIDRAMRDETLDQTRIALAVAIPAVLLVLMLVLRAPLAAMLVTGFAVSVLPVGYGLTAIVASLIRVDAVAVAGASMVGLALSVGFGLLMVSRFREELDRGSGDPAASAQAAAGASTSAGRAVLIAGTAMVAAMVISSMLSMTEILNSIGIGATLMAFVAAAAAVGVLPAVLGLMGPRIAAASVGPPAGAEPRSRFRPGRFAALPALAAAAALVLMVALSAPIINLSSGPPDAKLLPPGNQARQDFEAVAGVMGPGWVSPFEVIVARNGAPITTRKFLAQVGRFERGTARDRAVESVLGPGALLTNAKELQGVPKGLNTAAATAKTSKNDLKKLIASLKLATDGVAQLRSGLGSAASGAGQLHGGTGQAYSGSGQLKTGLDQAGDGARQLKAGAAAAAAGAKELAGGLSLAKEGVAGGMPAIQKLITAVNANSKEVDSLKGGTQATKDQIAAAAGELAAMEVGRDDPHYTAIVNGLQRAAAANDQLAGAITTAAVNAQLNATTVVVIRQQVQDLQVGIGKLLKGGNELASGLGKLSSGNSQLASGIAQLDAGGAKLEGGLSQLNEGAGQLAAGLSSGAGPSGKLLAGMNTITGSVVKARAGIPSTKDLEKLRKEAPGIFDSGYFVLAAIDGAPRPARDAAAFVVNVSNGGLAGRITVVPKDPARDASTRALHDRLSDRAAAFARANGAQAAVGGTAADLIDYRNTGLERLPIVIAALALLTFVLIATVTRSLLVPAVAVVLNLLTASAAFGILALLFGGDSPPLGGPGFVDPVTMIAVVTVILALSIDYEVFALERLRLVTGAGLAMLAVLIAFAPSDLTLVRQFAIGMGVAVVIDSLFVRRLLVKVERPRTPRRGLHIHRPHLRPRPVHH
jgi:RND superfamily putative drug exporter